jgi:integrase
MSVPLDPSESYRYEPTVDTAVWLAVRDFVTAAVADTKGRTPYREATLNVAAGRLAAWCWQSAGLPLERGLVFQRDTIARFIAVGCSEWKPAARGNLRSQLLRMSEVLLGRTASLRKLGALPPSDPANPYSNTELVQLRNWASSQSTQFRRTNAAVLLALGAGAGLSAAEIGELRVGDIRAGDEGVTVEVGGERARTVPVRRTWKRLWSTGSGRHRRTATGSARTTPRTTRTSSRASSSAVAPCGCDRRANDSEQPGSSITWMPAYRS